MAAPAYSYLPVWGMEPWKSVEGKNFLNPDGTGSTTEGNAQFGGGSEITSQNLLAGLWTVTSLDANGLPAAGAQLKPSYAFPEPLSGLPPGVVNDASLFFQGSRPNNSRTSAKFYIDNGADVWDTTEFFAVINPPDAVKDRLRNLYDYEYAPNPFGDYTVTMRKGTLSESQWRMLPYQGGGLSTPCVPVPAGSFGGSVLSGNSVVSTSLFAPFSLLLRTDGADGEYPQHYGDLDAASLKPILESGDYYFRCALTFDSDVLTDGLSLELTWPHSLTG